VPGHSGHPGNDRCDQIAVAFSKGDSPRLFQGEKSAYFVDVDQLPEAASAGTAAAKPKKKGPVTYLSLVHGKLHRDRDWKSCEARVKGVHGARFKKVESEEEEASVLRAWGVS